MLPCYRSIKIQLSISDINCTTLIRYLLKNKNWMILTKAALRIDLRYETSLVSRQSHQEEIISPVCFILANIINSSNEIYKS